MRALIRLISIAFLVLVLGCGQAVEQANRDRREKDISLQDVPETRPVYKAPDAGKPFELLLSILKIPGMSSRLKQLSPKDT